jgi:nucleotide-binding universal stress UspA family protein
LDGSSFAAQALPLTKAVAKATGSKITLFGSVKDHTQALKAQYDQTFAEREKYLLAVSLELEKQGFSTQVQVRPGFLADATKAFVDESGVDLVVTTTRGKSGARHWLTGGVSRKLVQKLSTPILLVHGSEEEDIPIPKIRCILVALDGSIFSERALPYARTLAKVFDSELVLVTVPAVPEVKNYRAAADVVETIRQKAEISIRKFLEAVARSLRTDGLRVRTVVTGSLPARTIIETGGQECVDMIMLTSRGRGGLDLFFMGSVAERVVQSTELPVFMVPIHERRYAEP